MVLGEMKFSEETGNLDEKGHSDKMIQWGDIFHLDEVGWLNETFSNVAFRSLSPAWVSCNSPNPSVDRKRPILT